MSWLLDILRGVARFIYDGNDRNPTPNVSAQEKPARTSPPTQPETTPVRVATRTPPPSVSQRNSVDTVRLTTISKPPEKPSGSYATPSNWRPTNVLPVYHIPVDFKHVIEKPHASSGSDPPKKPNASCGSDPPKKPHDSSGSDPPKKPNASPGSDPPKKPHASSGYDPPKKPNASPGSDPPKKSSGSYATPSNWRSPINVFPVDHIPGDIKHVIENNQVPQVLKKRLSKSDYEDYFAALLYGEDYYIYRWLKENGTLNVTAEEQPATTSPPTQPKTSPARFGPSPSVSQRNSLDSVTNPPEKPCGSYATPSNRRSPTNVLPVYHIPGDIRSVIEKDQVPQVLKKCLSISNYADYFAVLLYAEDYYMEVHKCLRENDIIKFHSLKSNGPVRTVLKLYGKGYLKIL